MTDQPTGAEQKRASKKTEEIAKTSIPPGAAECFVAIPKRVSKGDGTKAEPGSRIVASEKTVRELELRGLAFRDESEAKAAFASWRRKEEAERDAKIEGLRKREENRARWKRLEESMKIPEWPV